MIKCNKCDSDMPSSYNYCIYCSAKLGKTEDNHKKTVHKNSLTPFQLGTVLGAIFIIALVILSIIII